MDEGRRNFIRYTGILAAGIVTMPSDIFAAKTKASVFSPRLGICTELSNSQILINSKYSYLEEGVKRFLNPNESEEVFEKKLEQLKLSGIPIEACNSFLPGA